MRRRINFKNLKIWQKGMQIVDKVYKYVERLPDYEKFNLTVQSIKSAVSIPSNIAERSGRKSNADYARFLEYSLTSAYELETQMLICKKRRYSDLKLLEEILNDVSEEQRMLFSYLEKVENS